MATKERFLVGITGGSASGKTSFLNRLMESFGPEEVCLLSQDNYYKPRAEQPTDVNGIENYDTPNSIDFESFFQDLLDLRRGKPVSRFEYTFNNPTVTPKLLTWNPAPIIIVEGIFVLYHPEVSNLLDLKLFIDSKEWLKLKRRIIRDKIERGYDLEDVLYRWEHHVTPTYDKYILPFKDSADLVIQNNHGFGRALEIFTDYLKHKINELEGSVPLIK